MDIKLARRISIEAAKEAGNLLIDNLEKVKEVSFKDKNDIVTEIDVKSEKIIIDKIKESFPDHTILSEESGFDDKNSEYIWVIDPLDGTINYYHGGAPFRVGICLLKNKESIISAVYNPIKDEMYFAEKGKGATVNGKRIKVNDNNNFKYSSVMTHLSSKKDARTKTMSKLDKVFENALHVRFYGCGLAALTYIASGKFDVFFNIKTSQWDILPGALLVEEAGGKVTDIEGNKITFESTSILATNGKVHDKILNILKE